MSRRHARTRTRFASRIALLILALFALFTQFVTSCRAPEAPARFRPIAPLVEPMAFRFESVWFDTTVAESNAMRGGTSLAPGTIAGRIDEFDGIARWRERAHREPAVVEAPPRRHEYAHAGERVALPAAEPNAIGRSNGAFVEVSATLGTHWQLYDLHFDLVSRAPGERPQSLKASTEMPPDLWFEITVVPDSARAPTDRIVIVYVRAVAIWPPTGDA